jgi:hypothetical protein
VYIKQIPASNGPDTTGWVNGGGLIQTDPQIASQGGAVLLTALGSGGAVYVLTFNESTQTFGDWRFANGILSDETIAAQAGSVYLAGHDGGGRIYWYDLAADRWFLAGGSGGITALAGAK